MFCVAAPLALAISASLAQPTPVRDDSASATPALAGDQSSPDGCWNTVIELPWPAGDDAGELCLEHRDGVWAGRIKVRGKWRELSSVRVGETTLVFSTQMPIGNVTFKLTYGPKKMKGTVNTKRMQRDFRATRR